MDEQLEFVKLIASRLESAKIPYILRMHLFLWLLPRT